MSQDNYFKYQTVEDLNDYFPGSRDEARAIKKMEGLQRQHEENQRRKNGQDDRFLDYQYQKELQRVCGEHNKALQMIADLQRELKETCVARETEAILRGSKTRGDFLPPGQLSAMQKMESDLGKVERAIGSIRFKEIVEGKL